MILDGGDKHRLVFRKPYGSGFGLMEVAFEVDDFENLTDTFETVTIDRQGRRRIGRLVNVDISLASARYYVLTDFRQVVTIICIVAVLSKHIKDCKVSGRVDLTSWG